MTTVAPATSQGAILAFDIGTSSTRALIFDAASGNLLTGCLAAIRHDAHVTTDGASWLDPEMLVEEAITCAELALRRAEGTPILAVGGCSFWHSFVGVDATGRPTTPVLLWSDRRSTEQVARLKKQLGPEYTQRTGCPFHTSYCAGRLLWLAETEPEAFRKSTRFVSPAEYVYGRLFGFDRATASHSMASGTGLFDAHRGEWDEITLAAIPGLTTNHLSAVSDEPISGLLSDWWDRLPDLAGASFYPLLGDGACSNLGCGATGPERLALMVGTSGAMRVVVKGKTRPTVPDGLWRYLADDNRVLLGGALSNGGSVWKWLTDTVKLPALMADDLDAAIGEMTPDAHGLTILPFLSGERAPLWRDDATAIIAGLTRATTPLDLARAHYEAIAYRFAAIRERLLPVAPRAEIVGTGAALKKAASWVQIIADVLGEPIALSDEDEASARGAALWVRERLNLGTIETTPSLTGRVFLPNPAHADTYAAARARHESLLQISF